MTYLLVALLVFVGAAAIGVVVARSTGRVENRVAVPLLQVLLLALVGLIRVVDQGFDRVTLLIGALMAVGIGWVVWAAWRARRDAAPAQAS